MDKIDAVIVDDEEFAIIELKEMLREYPDIELLGSFSSPQKALQFIHENQPSLLFLDIEMPDFNGFQILTRLEYEPLVVFCTGHPQYAVEGYDYDPTDFVLKPIKKSKFQKTMIKVVRDFERKLFEERLQRQKVQLGYFPLSYKDEDGDQNQIFIWPEELSAIEPDDELANHSLFTLQDGQQYSSKTTLKEFLEQNEKKNFGFIQIHKSIVINKNHIKEVINKSEVTLEIGGQLKYFPISRRHRKDLEY